MEGGCHIEKGGKLSDRHRWSHIADLVGTGAVVVSLIYVGLQVRQNTAAIQTSTSQDVYEQHQDMAFALQGTMEPGMAAGWLQDLGYLQCKAGMPGYWERGRNWYHPTFRLAVDSAFAVTECPG